MEINSHYLWGISQKGDGQMKVYSDNADEVLLGRKNFFKKLNLKIEDTVSAGLVHGDNIALVGEANRGQKIEGVDGLITSQSNLILTITVADCLPLYFFDGEKKAVGLAHAGWRGVAKNIAAKMLKKMQSEFGTDLTDLKVHIGPHIKQCHFEIKDDVAAQFADYQDFIIRDQRTIKLDLAAVVKQQLAMEGLQVGNISISDECTHCLSEKYYSFRRDHPDLIEVMLAYAVIGDY